MNEAPQTTESAAPILQLRGVGRRFGGLRAVADVTFSVKPGERRAILGPNGAGKTTLFNVISGEFPPTEGSIELFGRDVTGEPARRRARRGLARTFQTSKLLLGLSVEDNLYIAALGVRGGHLLPVRLPGRERELRGRARATAAAIGLDRRLDALVRELSHGERRQLEVGMAQVSSPRLMMLDEPAAGLSPGERNKLTEQLLALDPNVTLLLIEHDMDVALRVATWVTMMHNGRVVVEGSPATIRDSQLVNELYIGKRFQQ